MNVAAPLTIVLPWYGPATAGGAEDHARNLVQTLHAAGVAVEVWTTTARDARAPIAPFYRADDDNVDNVRVRRFAANLGANANITRRFALDHPLHEINLLHSLAGSDDLLHAIAADRSARRWVFFLYAFPTTFWGVQLAGDRGYVVPCLHDEPYAYNSTTRRVLRSAHKVLANSTGEQQLICRLSERDPADVPVVGEGIDLDRRGAGADFRATHKLNGPLIYFAGRRDHTKNWPLLYAYFGEYLARRGAVVTLISSGPGAMFVPPPLRSSIVDLGFVSDQTKHDAYAAADVFCMPGVYESFSIVIMEAWLQATPALVHADCAVTVEHCRQSNGGLWFGSFNEFAACLDRLISDHELRRELGANGQTWVRRECRWPDVARRLMAALGATP